MTICYICRKTWGKGKEPKFDFCGVCMKRMWNYFISQFEKRLPRLRLEDDGA